MSQDAYADLRNVEALVFDVFGTTLDWHGSIVEELASIGRNKQVDGDWSNFAKTWRRGYIEHVQKIAQGNDSSLTMDELHRELLEKMLLSPEWKHLGAVLDAEERTKLNNVWHRLQGAMKQLSLEPQQCAMVATHAWDLRGAAKAGMKTVYVTSTLVVVLFISQVEGFEFLITSQGKRTFLPRI
ncbi:hypothetical protein R3P38DRAFT_2763463 [Favolaschia claudopus]|uniref:Haloacid dehalogenase n=1 Tax=Favolaschia claudopus TaxID=2862362 RepID=A0AAW0DHC4_9AGAR